MDHIGNSYGKASRFEEDNYESTEETRGSDQNGLAADIDRVPRTRYFLRSFCQSVPGIVAFITLRARIPSHELRPLQPQKFPDAEFPACLGPVLGS